MFRALIALSLLAVAGCQGSFRLGGLSLDQVRQISVDDLSNAHAKAMQAGDKAGAWCWEALSPIPSPQGSTTGIASTLEDARILALALHGPCSGIAQPLISFVTGL